MARCTFCSYSTTTTFIHSRQKPYPIPDQNGQNIKVYARFQNETAHKPYPLPWGNTYLYSLYKGVLPWASGSSLYVRSRSCTCNMPPRALAAAYYASSSSTIYQSLDEVRPELPCTKTYFALLVTTFHCVIFIVSGLFCS